MKAGQNRLGQIAVFAAIASAALSAFSQTNAALIATITVPGLPLEAFDIGWIDPSTQIYYFADRSNKAVDVIDAKTNAFLGRIEGFAGPSSSTKTAGPNGVVVLSKLKQVWASNGDSTVKIIDIASSLHALSRPCRQGEASAQTRWIMLKRRTWSSSRTRRRIPPMSR